MKPETSFPPGRGRARGATRPALTGLAVAAMLAFSTAAHPLSLGRMSVLSALGEPLRAEIDVTSLTPEQTASLQVGLASAEVYRAAGMDYSELLRGTQVVLTRRTDGRSVLQVSSDRAARDPFVDLILQATWANGRLVREYTVLLDPPRPDAPGLVEPRMPPPSSAIADAVAPPPPALPAVASVPAPARPPAPQVPQLPNRTEAARSVVATPAPPVPALALSDDAAAEVGPRVAEASGGRTISTREVPAGGNADRSVGTGGAVARPAASPPSSSAAAKVRARASATPAPRTSPPSIAGRYTVRAGDTLYRIARDARPEAVSLDQMLVALYRSNAQAFRGDNMNRLFAGAVLTVPDAATAAGIDAVEARQVIQAHSADMAAYRQLLAERAGLTGEGSATRASGRVEALVKDSRQPATPSPDQLRLSQATLSGTPSTEVALSRQAETQEAARRESEIQRNLQALKQLEGDTKTASAPDASSGVAGAAPAVGAATTEPGSGPALSGIPTAQAITSPATESAAASAPADQASAPAEPSVVAAEDAHSPMLAMYGLAAGGALGTLLLALGGVRLIRHRKGMTAPSFLSDREAIEPRGDLPEIPSLNATEMTLDEAVAQRMSDAPAAGPDVTDARTGDPVAEAEVYMAYGRMQDAERLLQSAMREEPHRLDIQLKLLEFYAAQKDLESFDAQAENLYESSRGQGPEWSRALGLRRSLVPSPPAAPRVSAGGTDAGASFDDDVDLGFPPEPSAGLSPTLDAREVAAMARAPRPTPPEASSLPLRPIRSEVVPSLGPEPERIEADDFALEVDPVARSRPPRPQRDVDLGQISLPGAADPEAGDPLDRKLALAEEFTQIGDVERARDLLGEVAAKGDAPLSERARRLLNALG